MSAEVVKLKPAILVSKSLLSDIGTRSEKYYPNEAGGFLLGVFKGRAIEIRRLTGPYARDKSTRTRFVRRDPRHKALAIAEWIKSGKLCTLVGDWHSHPDGGSFPSSIDTGTWSKMSNVQSRNIVGIIQGKNSMGIFWYDFKLQRLCETRLIEEDNKITIWKPIRS